MSDHRLVDMTAAEAGAFLRKLCEMTASGSQDWDNMQAILEQFVGDAYKGGQRSRDAEVAKLQAENAAAPDLLAAVKAFRHAFADAKIECEGLANTMNLGYAIDLAKKALAKVET